MTCSQMNRFPFAHPITQSICLFNSPAVLLLDLKRCFGPMLMDCGRRIGAAHLRLRADDGR